MGSSVYGFSRQEYWSGLPCPPSGDLLDPGIEPVSLISPTCSITGQGTKILTISLTPKQTSQMPGTEAGFSQRNTKEGLANEGDKTQRTKQNLKSKSFKPVLKIICQEENNILHAQSTGEL